jgi:hypothetical protein
VTFEAKALNEVPSDPGLYAMYGGLPPRSWVAYVGQAGNLAQRLSQHLDRRDSSVTTGTRPLGFTSIASPAPSGGCILTSVTRTDVWLRSSSLSASLIRRSEAVGGSARRQEISCKIHASLPTSKRCLGGNRLAYTGPCHWLILPVGQQMLKPGSRGWRALEACTDARVMPPGMVSGRPHAHASPRGERRRPGSPSGAG